MPSPSALWPVLQEEIRPAGRITFHRFMELCLYHPQHGYYSSGKARLGAGGDFYTNAQVAPVFARLLARHFELLWRELGLPARFDLVELGPGDGRFVLELLPWIERRFPEFSRCLRYYAVERSPAFRSRLEENLKNYGDRAGVLPDLPSQPSATWRPAGICGCVFANEFFDALPIHILVWRAGGWRERYVCLEGKSLTWCEAEVSSPVLAQQAELRFDPALAPAQRPEGWIAEICPLTANWMEKIGQALHRGEVLVFDYGYHLYEWQLSRFPQGSALAYRQHQASENLLSNPGEQDLTAHVNFSHLIETAERCALRWRDFSQAKFLLDAGSPDEFHDLFADCPSEAERQRRALLLKTLILPQGMGESFRVLVMEKKA